MSLYNQRITFSYKNLKDNYLIFIVIESNKSCIKAMSLKKGCVIKIISISVGFSNWYHINGVSKRIGLNSQYEGDPRPPT